MKGTFILLSSLSSLSSFSAMELMEIREYRAELKLLGSNKVFALLCMFKWIWILSVGFSSKKTFKCPKVSNMRILLSEKLLLNKAPVIIDMVPIPVVIL